MTTKQINHMAAWASEVADSHNKSITYVLMKLHEAMTQYGDIEHIKSYVLKELNEVYQ